MEKRESKKNSYRVWFGMALMFFFLYTLPAILHFKKFNVDFRSCFYTPELFSKSGIVFLRAFVFELPFAVVRWTVNMGMIPLIGICLFGGIICLTRKRINKEKS